MKKYKNIVFTTSEPLKNRGNFLDYLLDNTELLIVFSTFQGYSNEKNYIEKYVNGEKKFKKEFPSTKLKNKAVLELTYGIQLGYVLWKYIPKNSFIIVDNPFLIFFTGLISYFKQLNSIFWIGDYFPNYKGVMKVYNWLVNHYNKSLKYVLYVSPPIGDIYLNNLTREDLKGKHRALVSFGFNQKITKKKKSKNIKLGFIGVLRKMQGIDLLFDYLLANKRSDITLEIIGEGYSLDYYKNLAKNMKLTNKVKFYGHVKNVDSIVAKWDIGMALYENKKENYSIFCEPTKMKNYLSYGLPVITTKTTYFHKEISKFHAGEVIEESVENLSLAIKKIMNNYSAYLNGVRDIGKKYEYKKWYDAEFKFLEKN